MFNPVEYIRNVCQQKKIPICQLEKDCGFANGYLNPKKLKKIPYDRAVMIADYLDISVSMVLTGEEEQKENPTTQMGSEAMNDAGYYQLNEENKAFIDQMIEKLLKAQSGE